MVTFLGLWDSGGGRVCGIEGGKLDLAIASVVRGHNPALRKPALRCIASNDSSHSLFKR